MSDVSLVPVDYQPDFGSVSLVPVDHNPFDDNGTIQQAPTQFAQIPLQSPQTQPQVQQAQFQQPQTQPAQLDHNPATPNGPDEMIRQANDQLATQAQRTPIYNNPEADAAAMSPETYVNPLVRGMMTGLADLVAGPGRLITPNPYPPGSEEADWFEGKRAELGASWAADTALMMAGAGLPMAERRAAGALGGKPPLPGGAAGAAENAPQTFYRGDQAGLTEFRSHAARVGGQANSEAVLANGDRNDLMAKHAIDSRNPPSPYISVTTDPDVAGSHGDTVYRLQLAPGRAIPNASSPYGESEYLVPHYISPDEIKGTLP
jgi:hypothetical protein